MLSTFSVKKKRLSKVTKCEQVTAKNTKNVVIIFCFCDKGYMSKRKDLSCCFND